ncbi:MAG: hypothetical protein HY908_36085, partial [Myxococcales bacterium]|nr:hypothetical protein [Myxococcales bacterium]
MELTPGAAVTPSIRLVRPLGQGGMGAVWVAHHEGLDTEVAVKFMSAEILKADPTMAQRFTREGTRSRAQLEPQRPRFEQEGGKAGRVERFEILPAFSSSRDFSGNRPV